LQILESKILKLRAPELKDLELLYKWENDTSIWEVSNTIVPFSKYILKKYIENCHFDIYQTRQLRLMIDLKNENGIIETIGSIDLFDFDPYNYRAGIGILISEDKFKQKGYATEALKILIDYSKDILQLHQLFCNITTDNEASIKLFKNAGFSVVGKKIDWIKTKNGWKDECVLQLIFN
jgi:diamine N-acetyltransferase